MLRARLASSHCSARAPRCLTRRARAFPRTQCAVRARRARRTPRRTLSAPQSHPSGPGVRARRRPGGRSREALDAARPRPPAPAGGARPGVLSSVRPWRAATVTRSACRAPRRDVTRAFARAVCVFLDPAAGVHHKMSTDSFGPPRSRRESFGPAIAAVYEHRVRFAPCSTQQARRRRRACASTACRKRAAPAVLMRGTGEARSHSQRAASPSQAPRSARGAMRARETRSQHKAREGPQRHSLMTNGGAFGTLPGFFPREPATARNVPVEAATPLERAKPVHSHLQRAGSPKRVPRPASRRRACANSLHKATMRRPACGPAGQRNGRSVRRR